MTADTDEPSNFTFLGQHDDRLAKLGREAEQLASLSPSACLMQLRLMAEIMANLAAAYSGVRTRERASFFQVLDRLQDRNIVYGEVREVFHTVRQDANEVVHGNYIGATGVAINYLKLTRTIAIWFHQSFGDPDFSPRPFRKPPNLKAQKDEILEANDELREAVEDVERAVVEANNRAMAAENRLSEVEEINQQLREERSVYRELAEEYEQKLAGLQSRAEERPADEKSEQDRRIRDATDKVDLSESETRAIIDAQLRQAGWMADFEELRWSKGERPTNDPDEQTRRAIAEVPTASGPADYVLFDGLTPVAVVEAKRRSEDVRGAIEQAKRYARDYEFRGDQTPPEGSPWTVDSVTYKIPFAFATNGRKYLDQLAEVTGVWFQDLRGPYNRRRALAGWYSPRGLQDLLGRDRDAALEQLEERPLDEGLWHHQKQAIRAIEGAARDGRRRALLAMATGTGKTRTAINLIYRLVDAGVFRRVLFLVDRNSLGRQAYDSFCTTDVDAQKSFTQIFDTIGPEDARKHPEPETRLQITTIQSMVQRVVDLEDAAGEAPPVDTYDCIIVDECHRGYNLDREMSETELEWRSQEDYISKYRRVIDYFDAFTVGLTATPALHTSEIFGRPVYSYRYQQAVIDGHLVDHDDPIRIDTQLGVEGIHYEAGDQVQLLDRQTGEIDFAEAPDEIDFEIDSFNSAVLTEGFNEAICRELADHIDPHPPGKTLIFCVTDVHADMVVDGLKAAYAEQGRPVTDMTIKKITGYADDPKELLLHYKNEQKPTIAVTVDYLTTGVDVPPIVNLVFLRRVKSRILYEQMIGRATRQCPRIHKDAFKIYDCVRIYDALESVTDMQPVVTRPSVSLEQLYEELTGGADPELQRLAQRELVAKVQRKLRRLSDEGREQFEEVAGCATTRFLEQIRDREAPDAGEWLAKEDRKGVIDQIPRLPVETDGVVYDTTPDEVISNETITVERDDYLESFEEWVSANIDQIEALQIVARRPRELTRQDLLEVRRTLARNGYNTETLQNAWAQKTDREVAASIIGFIRQAALGDPLVPYADRVKHALARVKSEHDWNGDQQTWLERIAKNLIENEYPADPENLNQGRYAQKGGFERIDRQVFDGRLGDVLSEFNEAIWEYERDGA